MMLKHEVFLGFNFPTSSLQFRPNFGSMDKLSNPCPKMLQIASKCTFLLPKPLEPENTQKKHKELK